MLVKVMVEAMGKMQEASGCSIRYTCLVFLCCLLGYAPLYAAADKSDELLRLEAQMLELMNTNQRDSFYLVTDQLKELSKKEGEERLYYRAWGNQGIYDASHQFNANANEIAQEMTDYARQDGSIYGEFAALHTKAMILLQMQDNDEAEKAFLEALNFRRRHFPNESAAEDLRELMKIAYYRGDLKMAKKYGNQLLGEPNVKPHHKGRALSRLCVIAFEENNVEEFNHIYDEMNRLAQTDGIKLINLYTEVNHHIINGDYKQALLLVDRLAADTCAERKALIYHLLGDNEKAYEYMALFKHISDSIERVSHDRDVASLYLRMNNDRLRLERELLSQQNSNLRYRFYFAVGIVLILILLFVIYQRHKIVRILRRDNTRLDYGKKGAERTLKDLHELSFYESKKGLTLDMPVKVNRLGDHLTSTAQKHCHKGVITIFQTDFTDDFVLLTNSDALEKILNHLINSSLRHTNKGMIWLKCADADECVRFSLTDTCMEAGNFNEEADIARSANMNLNICESICRLLHGHIWQDKDYANGTRFVFEIPKTVIDKNN